MSEDREQGRGTPRRRVLLKVQLGADSWDEMAQALRSVAFDMHEAADSNQDRVSSVSGGVGWGGHWEGNQDRSVTHESYFEENERWLAERRASGQ